MPDYKVQVVFPNVSGLPRDVSVNTFCFSGSSASVPLDVTLIGGLLESFYNDTYGVGSISDYLSARLDRTVDASINFYNMSDPPGSGPVGTWPFTLGAAADDTSLPAEVALCVSFFAVLDPARPGTTRGRIYLGPLSVVSGVAGADDPARPGSTFIEVVHDAAEALGQAANTSSSVNWQIHSRATATLNEVIGGWVDNEWDTQRRRGLDSTARSVWSASA